MRGQTGLVADWIATAVGVILLGALNAHAATPRALVGAYYFDGWAGKHRLAGTEAWAKDAPTHLSKRMLEEFPDREPIWGWRDDKPEVMEQQIDLAADHGIAFFAFCWYWHPTPEEIRDDSKHTGLNLFLKARNGARMKFCLLVANHEGFLIGNAENWRRAAEGWMPYLRDKRYVTVDGKPLVIIFNPADGNDEGLAALQAVAKKAGLPGVAVAACGGGTRSRATRTGRTTILPWATRAGRRSIRTPSWSRHTRRRGRARPRATVYPGSHGGLGQAAVGRAAGAGPEAGVLLPRPHAGGLRAVPAIGHRLDGQAPGADDEGAAGPRVRLERVRRGRLYRADQRRPDGPVFEGDQVRRSARGERDGSGIKAQWLMTGWDQKDLLQVLRIYMRLPWPGLSPPLQPPAIFLLSYVLIFHPPSATLTPPVVLCPPSSGSRPLKKVVAKPLFHLPLPPTSAIVVYEAVGADSWTLQRAK